MRADVKLGVVSSAVIVLLAGGYYVWRSPAEEPVSIGATGRAADTTQNAKAHPAVRTDGPAPAPTPRRGATSANRGTPTRKQRARHPGTARPTTPDPTKRGTGRRSASNAGGSTTTAGQNPSEATRSSLGRNNRSDARNAATPGTQGKAPRSSGTSARVGIDPRRRATAPDTQAPTNRKRPNRAADAAGSTTTTRGEAGEPMSARRAVGHRNGTPRRTLIAQQPDGSRRSRTGGDAIAVEKHIVQPGDSLSAIARRYYGSEKYTSFLIQSNLRIANPDLLAIGTEVRIPPKPRDEGTTTTRASTQVPRQRTPSAASANRRTYRVREGDSFYGIARDVLGDATRWQELLGLNRDLVHGDPTRLRAGQVIALPVR